MTCDKRRRTDGAQPDVEFYLRDYAESANDMLLFGRDASGGSVCIRVPHERTLYLLPPAGQPAPAPAHITGFMRSESRQLERAFAHQGDAGLREWQVITYRAHTAPTLNQPSLYEQRVASSALIEAFLIERCIKSTSWLLTRGAQIVASDRQLTHCHAEYTATDIVESTSAELPPPIVVLRIANARIEQISCADGSCVELESASDDVATIVALHDPDVLHGNTDELPRSLRFRDRAERIRRPNLDAGADVWHANLVAQACGSPLKSAVSATSVACQFALLHAMAELNFLPVLPAVGSLPVEQLTGGMNLDTEPGVYRGVIQLYDYRSLYPSLVLEHRIDLRPDLHEPLLPALMRQLVDARLNAPSPDHAAAYKVCANTLIGCFAQTGGRLYCPSVNQRINGHGRGALNRAVAIARRQRLGLVIAGQTDSLLLACTGDPAETEQRLLAAVNKDYQHVQLALKATWTTAFMSAKKNRYAALDEKSLLTTKGMLDKTQTSIAQKAIVSAVKQLLAPGANSVTFDAETLALPADQRDKVRTAIAELCDMVAGMTDSDVRRLLHLDVHAMQRIASVRLAPEPSGGDVSDHVLRPGVSASDTTPPPVVSIEDLFSNNSLPLCLAASAAVIADARDVAPAAYPHMQHTYLALRSFGLSHNASRNAVVRISPVGHEAKRRATLDGMRNWPNKAFAADKQRRGGDERAASCMWSCAGSARCAFKTKADAGARRALLAQRGVGDIEGIEALVELGQFETACAREFAASHQGRELVGGKPVHPAKYVQQSCE